MTVLESIVVSIFCFALVFLVIACIFVLIKISTKAIQKVENWMSIVSILSDQNKGLSEKKFLKLIENLTFN